MRNFLLVLVLVLAAATAGCATSPDPHDGPVAARAAPTAVGVARFTVPAGVERSLPAIVWYPSRPSDAPPVAYLRAISGVARADAAPADSARPWPVVVISHGSGAAKENFAYLGERLAGAGYLAVAVDHLGDTFSRYDPAPAARLALTAQRPRDVTALLDAIGAGMPELPWLSGAADLEHVAVFGHSFGGYTALALAGAPAAPGPTWTSWCATRPAAFECTLLDPARPAPLALADRRVDAVIAAASSGWPLFDAPALAQVGVPVLLLAGGADRYTPPAPYVQPLFEHLGGERWLVELPRADHFTFMQICPFQAVLPEPMRAEVAPGCAPDAPLPLAAAQRLLADLVVDFADATLRGRSALAADTIRARAARAGIEVQVSERAGAKIQAR